jgi:two-component system response regulator HydG
LEWRPRRHSLVIYGRSSFAAIAYLSFMSKVRAKILIIDDDPDVLTAARVVLRQTFETVVTESNINKLDNILRQQKFDVILLDMNFAAGVNSGNEGLFWLNRILGQDKLQKIILLTAYSDIQLAITGMKAGAADFIVKPWDNARLIALVMAALDSSRENRDKKSSNDELVVIGQSDAWKKVAETIRKVAATDANILFLGENGTGKNLLAKMVHMHSSRKDKPFIAIDLGSIAATLFESELFGHKKGAFTDAREDREGKFNQANGGTLFLDEIANLPLAQQAKLLSVLQTRQYAPVGSDETKSLDVRLITATNSRIHEAVLNHEFREDLLYRINTIEIVVPPLRERKEDISFLANYFLETFCAKYGKPVVTLSADALDKLQRYPWPGNVRELSHAMERAVIMNDHPVLTPNDFVLTSRHPTITRDGYQLDDLERNAILEAINRNEGNMTRVARELGLGRTTLYRKMEKYGIKK